MTVLSAWGVTFAGARKVLLPSFCRRPAWSNLTTRSLPRCDSVVALLPSRTLMVPSLLIVMSAVVRLERDRSRFTQHLIALAGDELTVVVDLHRAVAGVTFAARCLHEQEPVAVDGHVQRIAGLLERTLAHVVPGRAVLHEAHASVGAHEVVECGAVG